MIVTIIVTAATTEMIGALDGGAIRTENNATFDQPAYCGGQKQPTLGRRSVSQRSI